MPTRFGRYKIIKRLAIGGISEIFLALEEKGPQRHIPPLSRKVIIKKLLPQYAEEPRMRQLIHYEARLLAALNHANIVQVFDAGVDSKGESYMVQEFIDGTDLKAFYQIANTLGESLSAEILYYITEQILRALVHVHELRDPRGVPYNLIHRDLSPTNVMVSMSGDVKLLDFGLAKRSADVTTSGNLAGKIPYMAPEQFEKLRVDPRIDLFALGSVLYELGTGRHRFDGRTDMEIINRIRTRQEHPFSKVVRGLPPELVQVLSRAMVFDRDRRYLSAREMLDNLVQLPLRYPSFLSGRMELQDFMEYNFGATKIDPSALEMGQQQTVSLVTTFTENTSPPLAGVMDALETDLNSCETRLLPVTPLPRGRAQPPPPPRPEVGQPGAPHTAQFRAPGQPHPPPHHLPPTPPTTPPQPPPPSLPHSTQHKGTPHTTANHWQWPLLGVALLALVVTLYMFLRDPSPQEGEVTLTLKGEPAGSQVLLDGKSQCQLPCSVTLPSDHHEHELRVEAKGFFPWRQRLKSSQLSERVKRVRLRKYELSLTVESNYAGVKVAIEHPKVKLRYNYLPMVVKELPPNSLLKLRVKWKGRTKSLLLKLPERHWHTYQVDPRALFKR